ncbi:MAG: multiple sugar transport system permease protein [Kribbellaceae bacterium]|jgi:multiple sugar transport system permease protein|nr:multiple sugar transport system permease protein [Kribbellaceae bacterium]
MTRSTLQRKRMLPTAILLLGALYCLFPVAWLVIASTKSSGQLFSTFTLEPGTGLASNLRQLFQYEHGVYLSWAKNTMIYAFGGAALSTFISAMAGYALAKFVFVGRETVFRVLVAGVLIPAITLAIPQFFLMAKIGLADTYWSVLLPCLMSPFGIYLCRVYAIASIPDELLEAARVDGASESRVFFSVVMPVMVPGLVTVFLLQFVWIWNNFLLPYLMLSDPKKFPLTLGLYSLISQGNGQTTLYSALLIGVALSVLPLIAIILFLQRFWRMDLISGGVKG